MKLTITIFLTITASLSLISSLGQFFIKERKLLNYTLSALFFFLTILQVQALALVTGMVFIHPVLFFFNTTSLYMLGVIRYFAYILVSLQWEPLSKKKLFYFIPSGLALIFDLYFLSLPDLEKMAMAKNIFFGGLLDHNPLPRFILAGAGIQATAYWGIILLKIIKSRKEGKKVVIPGTSITYSIISIIGINILAAGYLLALTDLLIAVSVIVGLLIIGTFFISQMNPEFLRILIFPKEKKRYSRSCLTHIETKELHRRLMKLIDIEKIHTDENVTLLDCADELSITPHQLSEFLNERLNCNFYSFINQHRIKEAVRLLIDEPDSTILSIALMVGFNSKSSFYESFSRFMGMTPNQYRGRYLKNNK